MATAPEVPVGTHSHVVPPGDGEALRAAVREGGVVRLGNGDYPLSVDGHVAIDSRRSVCIIGEGRDRTRIVTEEKLTKSGTVFLWRPGVRVTVAGLAVVGPADIGGHTCHLLLHYGGAGARLAVEDVWLSGGHQAIKMEELDDRQDRPQLLLRDSFVGSPAGVLMLNSGYADIERTEFAGYGIPNSNQAHAIYLYAPVHGRIDRCRFAGSQGRGYDVHHYSPETPGRGSLVVRDCEFQGTGHGIITHPVSRTLIQHCSLDGVSVEIQPGGAIVETCSGRNRAQIGPYPDYGPPSADIIVRDWQTVEK